jgi:CTP-dependent riboflavin kinase
MDKSLQGILTRGHQVASRPSKNYPYSTLEKQKPFFKALGLDLYEYFNGTLNISITPYTFSMSAPQFTFELVEWTDLHPPETFSFSRCKVIFKGVEYEGWVYYPHPETKKTHFQDASLVEVIAPEIPNIRYGDTVELWINADEIQIQAGKMSENGGQA